MAECFSCPLALLFLKRRKSYVKCRLYTCGVINKNVADTEEKKIILEAVYKYAIFIL